jgi:hypothetical protein
VNFVTIVLLGLLGQGGGSHTLGPAHQRVLSAWLASHPNYRLAKDGDCDCKEQIDQMRAGWPDSGWKPVPNYHPYQVVGDFNGDGVLDFAVVLIETNRIDDQRWALAVFNGPFEGGASSPAFFEKGLKLKYEGVFFGPPRPLPYRLVVGPFESDAGGLLVPDGRGYRWDDSADDE